MVSKFVNSTETYTHESTRSRLNSTALRHRHSFQEQNDDELWGSLGLLGSICRRVECRSASKSRPFILSEQYDALTSPIE